MTWTDEQAREAYEKAHDGRSFLSVGRALLDLEANILQEAERYAAQIETLEARVKELEQERDRLKDAARRNAAPRESEPKPRR